MGYLLRLSGACSGFLFWCLGCFWFVVGGFVGGGLLGLVWFVSLCDYLPGSSWVLCACGLISGFAVLVDLLHLLVLAAGFRALRGFGVGFLLCAFVGVLCEWGFSGFLLGLL